MNSRKNKNSTAYSYGMSINKLLNRKHKHIVMIRLRSILSLILVLVATLLVSCGGPSANVAPSTYTAEKIEQIQLFVKPVATATTQMTRLENLIIDKNWVDTGTLIHGPMGSLRQDMLNVSRNLLPQDQKRANQLAKDFFNHLVQIDAAARDRNFDNAINQFDRASNDLNAFLDLIPKTS